MATLRVKARAKPADGKINQNPVAVTRDRPLREQSPAPQGAEPSPASGGSLREYLKANH